jgi:RND superfamily putative drug exporter
MPMTPEALNHRPRPASTMLRPYGSRTAVRQLLLWEDDDATVMPVAHNG